MFPECFQRSVLRNRKKQEKRKKKREGKNKAHNTLAAALDFEERKNGVGASTARQMTARSRAGGWQCATGVGALLTEHTVTTLSLQRDDQRGAAPSATAGGCHTSDARVRVL